MNESEKLEKITSKIVPTSCPICGVTTNYVYNLISEKKESTLYYRCQCGIVFQENKPKHGCYNEDYTANYAGGEEHAVQRYFQQTHGARTYSPIIEELTLGRRMLDVGFNLPDNMNFFRKRGWVCEGIDVNDTFKGQKDVMVGKFEDYPFKNKYDLIWMSHVLEHFDDPIKVMAKAYDLMPENGVLFIATPDIDFINKTGVGNYPHWKKDEHYIMWSERALVREVERLGFNVVVKKRNFASRFVSWYDLHFICQKIYY